MRFQIVTIVPAAATTGSSTEPFVAHLLGGGRREVQIRRAGRTVGGAEPRGAGDGEVLRFAAGEQHLDALAELEMADRKGVAIDDHLAVGERRVTRLDRERIDARIVDPLTPEGGRARSADRNTLGVHHLCVAADRAAGAGDARNRSHGFEYCSRQTRRSLAEAAFESPRRRDHDIGAAIHAGEEIVERAPDRVGQHVHTGDERDPDDDGDNGADQAAPFGE